MNKLTPREKITKVLFQELGNTQVEKVTLTLQPYTLCHLESFLLHKQIQAAEDKFVKEGGFSERLAKKRREYRGY